MAFGVTPECRYGHGKLVKASFDVGGRDGLVESFYMASVNARGKVDMDSGYTVEIWECPHCSYREVHDTEPQNG